MSEGTLSWWQTFSRLSFLKTSLSYLITYIQKCSLECPIRCLEVKTFSWLCFLKILLSYNNYLFTEILNIEKCTTNNIFWLQIQSRKRAVVPFIVWLHSSLNFDQTIDWGRPVKQSKPNKRNPLWLNLSNLPLLDFLFCDCMRKQYHFSITAVIVRLNAMYNHIGGSHLIRKIMRLWTISVAHPIHKT